MNHENTADKLNKVSGVRVRKALYRDLASIFDIYNDAVLNSIATFDTEPKKKPEQDKWFEAHQGRYSALVAESAGKVVGWASLNQWSDRPAYSGTAEVSVYIDGKWQGKGIGRQLYSALIEEAKTQGFHALLARIAAGQEASLKLHRALGFFEVGIMREVGKKFGEMIDVHVYELLV